MNICDKTIIHTHIQKLEKYSKDLRLFKLVEFKNNLVLSFFQILGILFIVRNPAKFTIKDSYKKAAFFFLLNVTLCLGINYSIEPDSTFSLYPTNIFDLLLILLIVSILYINCHLLVNVTYNDLSLTKVKNYFYSFLNFMYVH